MLKKGVCLNDAKNHIFHLCHMNGHETSITFHQKNMAPGLPRFHVIST